jgi:hypothetical protein
MLPHYRNDPAVLAGRVAEGPKGYRRRRVELHHLAMSEIYGELNLISAKVRPMKWADQKIRETLVMMAATVADQPQHDLSCAETSQSCKQCSCPKNLLHDPPPELPPRRGSEVRKMVRNAALKGILELFFPIQQYDIQYFLQSRWTRLVACGGFQPRLAALLCMRR